MFDSAAVDELAVELEQRSDTDLLRGGSSYSNIFSGGAKEAPFCIQSMNLTSIYRGMRFKKIILFPVFHIVELARIIGLSLIEIGLAIVDFLRGIVTRKNPFKELKFIFSRIGACIILREIVRLRCKIDIFRGLRVIHANFVGYDEHAHRRGPGSAFAHWTLKGIDSVVRDIVCKAMRSERRDYQIIIYSDHGQEHAVDFQSATGRSIDQAVTESFDYGTLQENAYAASEDGDPQSSLRMRSRTFLRKSIARAANNKNHHDLHRDKIHIMAMGPLGHIYLPIRPEPEEMLVYSRRLVDCGKIPLVFYVDRDRVMCAAPAGTTVLASRAADIFGADHPFLSEITADMERICRHRHAGDFIISGWRPDDRPLTFPLENGSHGGPGSQETRGFLILPESLQSAERRYYRPIHLRESVLQVLGWKSQPGTTFAAARDKARNVDRIRVMTYNVHSCIGADGKLFPERIARVINRHSPDFIALQEVDRFKSRTNMQDQAALLGEYLGMRHIFWPILSGHDGEYGLAVLSAHPVIHAEFSILPQLPGRRSSEKRGIIHVIAESPAGRMHLFNTHLSLYRKERLKQIHHILQNPVLGKIPDDEPIIFCGDLNAGTGSPVHRLLSSRLRDAEDLRPLQASAPTFYSSWPMLRLDHIFHSEHLTSTRVEVIDDWECRLASDHLPVFAELAA